MDPAQPKRVLGLPEPRVLDAVGARGARTASRRTCCSWWTPRARWPRRTASSARRRASELLPQRRAGRTAWDSTIFSDQITPLIPIGPLPANAPKLRETVRDLIADGGTAVYDATIDGFRAGRARGVGRAHQRGRRAHRRRGHRLGAERRRGDRRRSHPGRLGRTRCGCSRSPTARARSVPPRRSTKISKASGGQAYEGDTEDIEAVYRSISSFF